MPFDERKAELQVVQHRIQKVHRLSAYLLDFDRFLLYCGLLLLVIVTATLSSWLACDTDKQSMSSHVRHDITCYDCRSTRTLWLDLQTA